MWCHAAHKAGSDVSLNPRLFDPRCHLKITLNSRVCHIYPKCGNSIGHTWPTHGCKLAVYTGSCIIVYLFEFENIYLFMFIMVEMWRAVTHEIRCIQWLPSALRWLCDLNNMIGSSREGEDPQKEVEDAVQNTSLESMLFKCSTWDTAQHADFDDFWPTSL